MLSNRFTKIVSTAIGAGAIGLAIATAGTASATTTTTAADEAFIAQMKAVGVTFDSPEAAAQQGQLV